jgi:propionyl-CoA synthetase
MTYAEVYRRWQADPDGFWMDLADGVDWIESPTAALDQSQAPIYRWFPGGRLNTCFNALDRHVEGGLAEQPALIYDSPVTGAKRTFTYRELRDQTALLAGALRRLGVERGDRVIIYMPMVPEAVMAMLACARIGAVHSVVFGGFAAHELSARIVDCQPKVILAASCGIEPTRIVDYKPLLDRAIAESGLSPRCVVLQRPQSQATLIDGRDLSWDEALEGAEPADCVALESADPLYILYTSGTTGQPKGIIRDNGGHAVAVTWSVRAVYDAGAGDVFWAASDIGWAVGHTYTVYAPLLAGCTTILYEGKPVGTPDAGAFWRVCEEHGVNVIFMAPTAIRAIKREDPSGALVAGYDLSRLRTLFLAGERCDPDTLEWAMTVLERPAIDHWWQTETGWPIAANCVGLELMEIKSGSVAVPVPGYDVCILDEAGERVAPGVTGDICIALPLPPGCTPTLWGSDQRWIDTYLSRHPGHYLTADAGYIDEDGYVFVMGRTDDVINIAGHRLSTGSMEEVLASHPDVAECAAVAVSDPLKGQVPLGFAVLKAGAGRDGDEVAAELVLMVRDQIGPVACFREAYVVAALPKTRSGKTLRGTISKMASGEPWRVPGTIEDPAVLESFTELLTSTGRPPLSPE